MNSALYSARVYHRRTHPRRHAFGYRVFYFWLDLDEVEAVVSRSPLISHNRWNAYTWREDDHLPGEQPSVKERLSAYLAKEGITAPAKIFLLTHLRTFGYQFNPVSFYFCYDAEGQPLCTVAEVSNTFREMKLYRLGREVFDGEAFRGELPKQFYISPFIGLDSRFTFRLVPPTDTLDLTINESEAGRPIFHSRVTGKKKPLSTASLLGYTLRFPLIPLGVMVAIHWQALRLWIKGIRALPKKENENLQLGRCRTGEDQTIPAFTGK